MKKKWKMAIIYIVLVVACIVVIYVVPSVLSFFESTYVLEKGEIEISDYVSAYVVRNETVYVASKAGSITRLSDEALLVKKGANVIELSGEGDESISSSYSEILEALGESVGYTSGSADHAGYISYYVDGLEGTLTEDYLEEIDEEIFNSLGNPSLRETASGSCAAGEPVYKIVKNGDYWIVYYVDNDDASKYTVGNSVYMTFDDSESGVDIKGYVYSVTEGDSSTKIVIESNRYFDDYLTLRDVDVTVVTSSATGLIVKNSSIIEVDGQQGVIRKTKLGNNQFVPIKVKATDGTNSVVYTDIYMNSDMEYVETVSVYDEVIKDPTESDIESVS